MFFLPSGEPTIYTHTEPISQEHCRKWHHEAEVSTCRQGKLDIKGLRNAINNISYLNQGGNGVIDKILKHSKLTSKCSFCTEWCSTAIVRFWSILTVKRWTCALKRFFFEEKPSFPDKPAPKLKINVSSYFYSVKKKKSLISVADPLHVFKRKSHPNWTCRVVHSPRFILVSAQFRAKLLHWFLFTGLLLAGDGDDVIVPPTIVVFPWAVYTVIIA